MVLELIVVAEEEENPYQSVIGMIYEGDYCWKSGHHQI